MSEVVLTKENFEKEVTGYAGTVLVDFWAPWCGPCRALGPVMADIAKESEEVRVVGGEVPSGREIPWGRDLKVGKVNVDEERELAERFSVMSIPTVKIFKGGKEVGSFVGFMPKEDILNYLKKVML